MACMNNQGWAAEKLISSILNRYMHTIFFVWGILVYAYTVGECVAVYSQRKTVFPIKVPLAHPERSHKAVLGVWRPLTFCIVLYEAYAVQRELYSIVY